MSKKIQKLNNACASLCALFSLPKRKKGVWPSSNDNLNWFYTRFKKKSFIIIATHDTSFIINFLSCRPSPPSITHFFVYSFTCRWIFFFYWNNNFITEEIVLPVKFKKKINICLFCEKNLFKYFKCFIRCRCHTLIHPFCRCFEFSLIQSFNPKSCCFFWGGGGRDGSREAIWFRPEISGGFVFFFFLAVLI